LRVICIVPGGHCLAKAVTAYLALSLALPWFVPVLVKYRALSSVVERLADFLLTAVHRDETSSVESEVSWKVPNPLPLSGISRSRYTVKKLCKLSAVGSSHLVKLVAHTFKGIHRCVRVHS
jgi:hypothetical protein